MAQYYASIQGRRGEATRMGDKKSSMAGHIRGWDIGGEVHMDWNERQSRDEVEVCITTGSNGRALCGFTAHRDEAKNVVLRVDPAFLCMVDDAAYEQAFKSNPAFAQQMKRLLFLNLDKLNGEQP